MRRITTVMTALVAALVLAGLPVDLAQAETVARARILIVGDSVTQGAHGDYTWRYRLWRSLRAADRYVDFVGPRRTLFNKQDGSFDTDLAYADPAFDTDHAARWGASMSSFEADLGRSAGRLAADYAADVVINDLGINDLSYSVSPSRLVSMMSQFVADVRAARPHASVVLGQLTQHWLVDSAGEPVVEQYNALLVDLAASLDRPDARVLAALAPSDYVEYVDTYDPAHPSASGEIKIGQQFAAALAQLPLPATPPPATPTSYAGAARLWGTAGRHVARLRFTVPRGATGQTVLLRNVSAGGRWRVVGHVSATRVAYRVTSLHRHRTYAFALRAHAGDLASTRRSNVLRLRTT